MPVSKSLSVLKRKKETLLQEGVLQDCWIETYRPAGTARGKNRYCQLRSATPFANGARRRHLKPEEIPVFRRLVENGRRLKRIEREIALLEGTKPPARAVLTSSASDEWYTPPEYITLAREVMGGIDLDPASSETAQAWIQAETCYTIKDNGLEKPWRGRLWLNPPYGAGVQRWTQKAVEEHDSGTVTAAIILVRPAAGAAWYQALSSRFALCTTHKRIRFIDKDGTQQKSPVHGNCFFYLGANIERFREVFGEIGVVTRVY